VAPGNVYEHRAGREEGGQSGPKGCAVWEMENHRDISGHVRALCAGVRASMKSVCVHAGVYVCAHERAHVCMCMCMCM